MKSTKNKTFRIQQRNQHLKNILEESYYIELGTIGTSTMERLLLGEVIKLEDVVHKLICEEGIGNITKESKKEQKYQFITLNSLRNKTASNKIFLTCGLLHYHLNDDTEYYAPIVLIPVEIDFNDETIVKSSKPIINNILINEIQAHLGVDISYNEHFKYLYEIDNYCINLAKTTNCLYSIGNYLTVVSVEYTENSLDFEEFSTERSIYEVEPKKILRSYFEKVKPVTSTNIYQKRALLKINSGESFVVDGKVSTGKTHTILNAISDAVQQNKKVLYVSQDTDSIRYLEKELRKYQLGTYTYNLCRNFQITSDEDNIIPNIREEKIGIETITPICDYEDALYSSIHGCNYSKIVTRLALIKNQIPEITKIPIEVSLENHEIQEIYQNLREIEKILDDIEPLDVNVWSNVEQYYNKSHINEIISATKRYSHTLKNFNKEMNAFCKKYNIKLPTNFINAQRLISYISTFEKLMPPVCWTKRYDPKKINELLETISNYQLESRQIKEVYHNNVHENYEINQIQELVQTICYKHLTIENEYEINNILTDEEVISKNLTNIKTQQKINNEALIKLSKIVDNDEFDETFFRYIDNLVALLKQTDIKAEWLDFYSRNSVNIVDHYNSLIDDINKYIYIKEKLQRYLVKEDSLSFSQIKELSSNRDFMKLTLSLFNKKLLKQNRISTDECYKMVIDLLEIGGRLLTEVKNTGVIGKENFDSFIRKYKVWIEFITKSSKKDLKLFNNHLHKSKKSVYNPLELLDTYNVFSKSKNELEELYISLSKYGVELETTTITEKNVEVIEWIDYLKRVVKTVRELKSIFKFQRITLDDLIKVINADREYLNLEERLNFKEQEMHMYLGSTYLGLETNCMLISVLEKHYGLFVEALVNSNKVADLFVDNQLAKLVEENKEIVKLADKVQEEHNLFSRYFIGGQSSILECSLADSVKKIHRYEERTKEVRPLFRIFEYVKHFDRLGLKHLGEGILESKYSKGISEIYIYSTYLDYQLELINKNPILSDVSNILLWLDNYNYFERNYCISSIKNLERNKVEIDKRILNRVKMIPFNSYQKIISELINYKSVFLMDLNIFNHEIDYQVFDLILIDDVNLSTAFKYNTIMECNQVVLFGDSTQTLNNSNNIFSQIPKRKILNYSESYIKDNPQYGNYPSLKNQYILDYHRVQSIHRHDDLQSFVSLIVNNYYQDTTKEINIVVHSNNYKIELIKALVTKLKEFFSDEDIFDLFEKNITIISAPNEATKVVDEIYFAYDDFKDIDTDQFKEIMAVYTTAKRHVYICSTTEYTPEIEDLTKHIHSILKYPYKEEKIMAKLTELIYRELLERGIKVECGIGRLDLIIKGKITRGKVVSPNVGIIIEGLDDRVPYSTLNDYQYYHNEYTNNGWKIFILFVDDIINNLQTRLDQISQYLSKDDIHITHQLKIDEFIG